MCSKRKYGSKKRKPSQQRYVCEGRLFKNKKRKAQKTANKIKAPVIIKVYDKLETVCPTVS